MMRYCRHPFCDAFDEHERDIVLESISSDPLLEISERGGGTRVGSLRPIGRQPPRGAFPIEELAVGIP